MVPERQNDGQADDVIAVLLSGGLDSVVLVAYAAQRGTVQPLYVSTGLAWERDERATVSRLFPPPPQTLSLPPSAFAEASTFAEASADRSADRRSSSGGWSGGSGGAIDRVRPLVSLGVDMRDVYPSSHWAVRGEAPAFDSPDEDVYIEGRNIVLLSKAAVYMARARIGRVMLGPLAANPFPDASASFFEAMGKAMSIGLGTAIQIETPFAGMHKSDVVRLGHSLGVPLERTLSCMQPKDGLHCGRCSKCRERRDAFADARVEDLTEYGARS